MGSLKPKRKNVPDQFKFQQNADAKADALDSN